MYIFRIPDKRIFTVHWNSLEIKNFKQTLDQINYKITA